MTNLVPIEVLIEEERRRRKREEQRPFIQLPLPEYPPEDEEDVEEERGIVIIDL